MVPLILATAGVKARHCPMVKMDVEQCGSGLAQIGMNPCLRAGLCIYKTIPRDGGCSPVLVVSSLVANKHFLSSVSHLSIYKSQRLPSRRVFDSLLRTHSFSGSFFHFISHSNRLLDASHFAFDSFHSHSAC
ncbi:hypothetical protein V2G26_018069 [Clonostachys chloroleuca]